MELGPYGGPYGEAEAADAAELAEIQQQAVETGAVCQMLREQVEAARVEKEAAKQACSAGIQAARSQILLMRAELAAAKALQAKQQEGLAEDGEEQVTGTEQGSLVPEYAGSPELDEERARQQALQIEARALRHKLAKWKHHIESLEAQLPRQQAEVQWLKAEITHTSDILESTRHVVSNAQAAPPNAIVDAKDPSGSVQSSQAPYAGGGKHGATEALAERAIRERQEVKNEQLSVKVKRFAQILSAQQLLMQRLEQDLQKVESETEQKEMQLGEEVKRQRQLKSILRKCSDELVVKALVGMVPPAPLKKHRSSSTPPGASSPGGGGGYPPSSKASSVAQLPQIQSDSARRHPVSEM